MKLLNYTSTYFAAALLIIIGAWATVFYVNMLDEVYDSLDDGLENYKILILAKARGDSTLLSKTDFEESNYSIHKIPRQEALSFRDIYRDTAMYMLNENDFEPVRMLSTAFEHEGHYYRLNVISSMVEEDDLIEDLFYAIVWLYLAMLVSTVLMNNFLLKRIWKPFYHLLDELKKFKVGKGPEITTVHTRVDEFRMLNETVEALLRRTKETFDSQKQFIENASHELQTPLAISINKLELLAERGTLPDEEMKAVAKVLQTLERLTRMNKSLLLLSRIENRQFQDVQKIPINLMVRNAISDFEDFARFKNVTVRLHENGELQATMHHELAEILISNLLKNAIVHNRIGGMVEVVVDATSFSVRNTGVDQPLDKARIFDRFHKNSHENSGTGLGLAIAKAIADLYGITIRYNYEAMHMMTVEFT